MKTKAAVVLGIAAAVALCVFVPSIRGPINRAQNKINESLEDEYVVDNYKAEAYSLYEKRKGVVENIRKFTIEKKVADKKLAYATERATVAKNRLVAIGTEDLVQFNKEKDLYETCRTEVQNFTTLISVYDNAIKKLEDTLAVIDSNISKIKVNIATLASKKAMASSLKEVNKTIENIQGIGEDQNLGVSVEKLDDAILEESLKIEVLDTRSSVADRASAEEYLATIKALKD